MYFNNMFYPLIRSLLFNLDAERAHALALSALRCLPKFFFKQPVNCVQKKMGLEFPNLIGLAAGLDKNGEYLDALGKLGFGFIEVGTVTPKPQVGNPKPRLFRIPQAQALINRMGFNNRGVDVLLANIQKSAYRGILGINIGKNKETPFEQAVDDYIFCLQKIYLYASYVTINISSPNTADLRLLHQKDHFDCFLQRICDEQKRLSDQHQRFVPLVIKLSPDESDETLKHIADLAMKRAIAGLIATNTSCDRETVCRFPHGTETGGLSGKPLASKSTHCLRILKQVVGDDLVLMGVGGIDNVDMAREKIESGASLLQIYTGLIYQGPGLLPKLMEGLMI